MEETLNQLEGIKQTIQRLQGVPVTENNVQIILAIINTTELLKQKIQNLVEEASQSDPAVKSVEDEEHEHSEESYSG